MIKDIAIGAEGLDFDSLPVKLETVLPTAHHRCDVSLELRCSGAKPRR